MEQNNERKTFVSAIFENGSTLHPFDMPHIEKKDQE
jgi:hypothetical protein